MAIIKEIQDRWSPRAFADTPITYAQLEPCFEAARWAPSSMNGQPWKFVVATRSENPELWEILFSCLLEGNQVWAKNAPVLMATITKETFDYNGKPNAHAVYDTGAAAAHFNLQAIREGFYTHQIGGINRDKAKEVLNLPDDHTTYAFMAMGHVGDPNSLPDVLKERELAPKVRKEMDQIVFKAPLS